MLIIQIFIEIWMIIDVFVLVEFDSERKEFFSNKLNYLDNMEFDLNFDKGNRNNFVSC